MLTITLAARTNVIEIAFASAVRATSYEGKKRRERGGERERRERERRSSVIDDVPLH